MWRFKDFPHHRGNVGRFSIWGYTPSGSSYDYCKITTFCVTADGVKWASKTLHELSLTTIEERKPSHDFNIMSRECRKAGIHHGQTEVSVVINLSVEAALAALVNVGAPPEVETITIKPGALSVGPCSYRDDSRRTYVKVRFNGYSVPFYFNQKEFLSESTFQALVKQVGGAAAEAAFKVLVDHQDVLHKRALERALNLSRIDDYAQHNLLIMKRAPDQNFYTATQAEMAEPDADLATVFTYPSVTDYYNSFAVIKDVVYSVKGFISGYNLFYGRKGDDALSNAPYNIDYDNGKTKFKGYMRPIDCVPLDPEDEYVREKIARSMKAKL